MPTPDAGSWFSEHQDGLRLSVKVTPRAAREAIGGIEVDARGDAWLALRITAPPEGGKANAGAIRLLARHLGVAPRDLSVVRGASGRRKVLHLRASGAALRARLQAMA
jgi:uncharacterized protein (TIGR00251 family)